jgi:tryptophan synthase alpha chain
MKNRIQDLFKQKSKKILSIYFTAGYPKLTDTMPILKSLQDNGVDMVEIGIPFSDPMADGPVIQSSGNVALKNGMSLKTLFQQLENLRSEIQIPVLLMGYINVVMQYGLENFCKDCKKVGIDGVIFPDLPMADYLNEYKPLMDAYGLSMVLLITPDTSEARIREIDEHTDSFIYMVSSASTTGAQQHFSDSKLAYFKRINAMELKNPRLVGFGISNKETLDAAWEHASGAIIGSRFIECLTEAKSIPEAVTSLLDRLKK